jgi:glutamate/tyrosine decarboxylase-like PLP-dependent enzyme
MKAEIISMCQKMLQGQSGAHGILTHGGTTSIIEACMAYVMHAREKNIEIPEIIVPETAHVAFDKAAELLNVKLIKVPVDPLTGKADVRAMEKAISSSTCLMVGSAPSYPYGILDPIKELAATAKKHNVPFHIDNCLGGGITAFARKAGFDIPHCDFSVPGVTSISFDTHKYLQTPKGTSVLLFHPDCAATPTRSYLDWVGGMYVTDDMDGSRSGADIATTWTVLCYKGENGYIEDTKNILTLQKRLVDKLRCMHGLTVAFEPKLSVVGIRTDEGINTLLVAQKLKEKNWSVNILQKNTNSSLFQLFSTPQVDGFHFCLTSVHAASPRFVETFTADLKSAIDYAKANPQEKPKGMFKAYGALEEGIPSFIQKRIGDGFAKINNAVPGKEIPGVWKPNTPAQDHADTAIITRNMR